MPSWLRVTLVAAGLSFILAACGAPAPTDSSATRPPGGATVPAAPTAPATAPANATPAASPAALPASRPPTRTPTPAPAGPSAVETPGASATAAVPPQSAATARAQVPTTPPTPPPSVTPVATPAPVATPTVRGPVRDSTIQASTFERHVRIVAGTTVVWTNADGLQHTVTAMDGSTDSPYLNAGESHALTFNAPGQFEFYCRPHLQMVTTVHVSAP